MFGGLKKMSASPFTGRCLMKGHNSVLISSRVVADSDCTVVSYSPACLRMSAAHASFTLSKLFVTDDH